MTNEDDPVFKIPIAYLEDKKSLKNDINSDLELTSGDNPFYQTLFDADNDFKKLTIEQQSQYFTDNKTYLENTQDILKQGVPSIPEYKDIMKIRKTLLDNEDFFSKYDYIEWSMLSFLNENTNCYAMDECI